mgnify:CR=1 FL=1
MCFTGGFALGMTVDPSVIAPVLSQPSLPLPVSKKARASIHLSPEDLRVVKERIDNDDICVLGMRFTNDRELGDGFIGVEIDSSEGNEWSIPTNAHSVVTEHLVDEPGHPTNAALEQVLAFFRERLLSA